MQMLSKTVTVPFIIYLLWLGWSQLGPQKPEMGPLRRVLADEAIVVIAEDLQKNSKGVRKALLMHFENDPTDYVTENLRRIIEQRGIFNLEGRTFLERLRGALSMRQPAYGSVVKVAEIARSSGAEVALTGQIHEFESYPGGAKARIDYALVSAGGTTLYKGQFLKTISDAKAAPAVPESQTSSQWGDWLENALAWLVVVLLLPVFTIGFIRAMARRKSNTANAFVLAVYTAIGVIAAFFLLGSAASGAGLGLLLLAAGALSLAYNIQITSLAVSMEE